MARYYPIICLATLIFLVCANSPVDADDGQGGAASTTTTTTTSTHAPLYSAHPSESHHAKRHRIRRVRTKHPHDVSHAPGQGGAHHESGMNPTDSPQSAVTNQSANKVEQEKMAHSPPPPPPPPPQQTQAPPPSPPQNPSRDNGVPEKKPQQDAPPPPPPPPPQQTQAPPPSPPQNPSRDNGVPEKKPQQDAPPPPPPPPPPSQVGYGSLGSFDDNVDLNIVVVQNKPNKNQRSASFLETYSDTQDDVPSKSEPRPDTQSANARVGLVIRSRDRSSDRSSDRSRDRSSDRRRDRSRDRSRDRDRDYNRDRNYDYDDEYYDDNGGSSWGQSVVSGNAWGAKAALRSFGGVLTQPLQIFG